MNKQDFQQTRKKKKKEENKIIITLDTVIKNVFVEFFRAQIKKGAKLK